MPSKDTADSVLQLDRSRQKSAGSVHRWFQADLEIAETLTKLSTYECRLGNRIEGEEASARALRIIKSILQDLSKADLLNQREREQIAYKCRELEDRLLHLSH